MCSCGRPEAHDGAFLSILVIENKYMTEEELSKNESNSHNKVNPI